MIATTRTTTTTTTVLKMDLTQVSQQLIEVLDRTNKDQAARLAEKDEELRRKNAQIADLQQRIQDLELCSSSTPQRSVLGRPSGSRGPPLHSIAEEDHHGDEMSWMYTSSEGIVLGKWYKALTKELWRMQIDLSPEVKHALARVYFGVTSWGEITALSNDAITRSFQQARIDGVGSKTDTPKGNIKREDKDLAMSRMTGLYPPVQQGSMTGLFSASPHHSLAGYGSCASSPHSNPPTAVFPSHATSPAPPAPADNSGMPTPPPTGFRT